jgi:hydrogenase nickel incorporation protein HypA/HybF
MHELSITRNILDITIREAEKAGADEITAIYIVMGELSNYVDDAINHYWHLLGEGTIAQNATLHFKRVPARLKCADCDTEFRLNPDSYLCPACESASIEIVAGEEFYIDSIDIEKSDPVEV